MRIEPRTRGERSHICRSEIGCETLAGRFVLTLGLVLGLISIARVQPLWDAGQESIRPAWGIAFAVVTTLGVALLAAPALITRGGRAS